MNLAIAFDPTNLATFAAMPSLTGAYLVALIVGGGLLVISTFLGGHAHADVDADFDVDLNADLDVDVDLDADIDVDADVDVATDIHADHIDAADGALSLASWFSIRFCVYFLAMFGLVGTVLTGMSALSAPAILALAAAGGFVVGQVVHQLFRYLKRSSVPGVTEIEDYVNKPARVTIAIRPPAKGEVAIHVGQGERFVAAAARRPDEQFDVGQSVAVVSFTGRVAVVVSAKEFEFLNNA